MSQLFPVLLLSLIAVALTAVFLVWKPLPRDVQRRVDAAVAAAASRVAQDPVHHTSWRARIAVFKRLFTLGMHHSWAVNSTSLVLLLAGLVAGGAVWLLFNLALGLQPWISAPAAVIAFWLLPRRLALMEQQKADDAFLDLFPDAIDMIIRMLRAGLPVSGAIRTVAREAPEPVSGAFSAVADQIEIGVAFEEALAISSQHIGLPDYRFFAAAIALQQTTGGNLTVTLEILADIIRKRRIVRLKAKAATAEERTSAYVLAAMPFLVIGALLAFSPAYLLPLIADPRGNIILVAGVAMLALAFLTMRYMMRGAVRM